MVRFLILLAATMAAIFFLRAIRGKRLCYMLKTSKSADRSVDDIAPIDREFWLTAISRKQYSLSLLETNPMSAGYQAKAAMDAGDSTLFVGLHHNE